MVSRKLPLRCRDELDVCYSGMTPAWNAFFADELGLGAARSCCAPEWLYKERLLRVTGLHYRRSYRASTVS